MNADYYGRLGVTRNAEDKDIKNVSAPRTARSRTARSRAASAALPRARRLARSLTRSGLCLPCPPLRTQAYRKAARQWHPDVNPSEEAKEKFQAINEAYSVRRGRSRTETPHAGRAKKRRRRGTG